MQTGHPFEVTVCLGDFVYLVGYLVYSTNGCWYESSDRFQYRAFTTLSA